MALDSGGSANGELIRRDDIIKVRVRITICTKKYFEQEKPLIYLVSALTVAWVNKQRQNTECIPPKFDGLRKPKKYKILRNCNTYP